MHRGTLSSPVIVKTLHNKQTKSGEGGGEGDHRSGGTLRSPRTPPEKYAFGYAKVLGAGYAKVHFFRGGVQHLL